MNQIKVRLSLTEMMISSVVGTTRQLGAMKSSSKDSNYQDTYRNSLMTHIDAAAAEMAFAKWMGVYWDGSCRSYKAPDVGEWQVRSTHHADGRLLIRKRDSDAENFALVITANAPEFLITGYLPGNDAKKDEFWHEGWSSWAVPQKRLLSFEGGNK